jgi:hypothetical protein
MSNNTKVKRPYSRHGKRFSSSYNVWFAMKDRCQNRNNKNYHNYGGRGIKVCERWQLFVNFYEDMGDRPPKYQIERIDNSGDYSPENCKWSTRSDQMRNTRNTRTLLYQGQEKCLTDWAIQFGIKPSTLSRRLSRGYSVEDALTTPLN